MEKKQKPATRREPAADIGSEAWWEQRLASVRGGGDLAIRIAVRRTDDDTTEDDSTCCDLDSSTNFTWSR